MNELELHLLGGESVYYFIAAFIFSMLGFVINKIVGYINSKNNGGFSLSFWIKDNFIDITLFVLLAFAVIRFTNTTIEIVKKYTDYDVSFIHDFMFYYFLVGLLHTFIVAIIKKKLKRFISKKRKKTNQK